MVHSEDYERLHLQLILLPLTVQQTISTAVAAATGGLISLPAADAAAADAATDAADAWWEKLMILLLLPSRVSISSVIIISISSVIGIGGRSVDGPYAWSFQIILYINVTLYKKLDVLDCR